MIDQFEEENKFSSYQKCNHLPELTSERYLMSRAPHENRRSKLKSDGLVEASNLALHNGQLDDQRQLFHVLITKPEIASKPRDHIIFEGDMDLKTTFETTYEALAKLRLANWKKYQESRLAEAQKDCFDPATVCCNQLEQVINPDDLKKLQENPLIEQQQQDVSFHQQPLYNNKLSRPISEGTHEPMMMGLHEQKVSNASHHLAHSNRECELLHAQINNNNNMAPSSSSSSSSTTTTTTIINSNNNNSTSIAAALANNASIADMQAATAKGKCPLHSASRDFSNTSPELQLIKSPLSQQHSNCGNNSATANYIDPDLSIIVYDANLNRLERLGVRKRSKYRPSTSLRSGSKGFFGDSEKQKPNDSTVRNYSGQSKEPQHQPTSDINYKNSGRDTRSTYIISPEPKELNTPRENTEREYELDPTELAMSARNLMSSHQGVNLLYTSRNLPVDSKRRCKDNVNMIDHIKEQNIVEHQLKQADIETNPLDLQTCSCNIAPQVAEQSHQFQNKSVELNQDINYEEMKNLAEIEEAEAVQEIQNISNLLDDDTTQMNQPSDYVRDAVSRADDDLRRSRLRRTCQNQNFDIYNNDYRDTSVGRDGISNKELEVKKPATRMSPSSTNLFKESSFAFC